MNKYSYNSEVVNDDRLKPDNKHDKLYIKHNLVGYEVVTLNLFVSA